jgi:predicted TIM-barrel fold metal-dependent hydrolase
MEPNADNTYRAIDFHTHAFPDELAARAIRSLEEESGGGYRAHGGGTIGNLLRSMDRAGIERAVIASIATRPGQAENIISWSARIQGPRIIPFASIHPAGSDFPGLIGRIREAGLKGVKLQPFYQDFTIDDPAVFPLYESIAESGLVLLFYAGFDLAFPDDLCSRPARILKVHRAFPKLKIVAAHLGGYRAWEEVSDTLAGRPVYLETSFSIREAEPAILRDILKKHSPDFFLFGTDYPWLDQGEELEGWKKLKIPDGFKRKILAENAERLLGL